MNSHVIHCTRLSPSLCGGTLGDPGGETKTDPASELKPHKNGRKELCSRLSVEQAMRYEREMGCYAPLKDLRPCSVHPDKLEGCPSRQRAFERIAIKWFLETKQWLVDNNQHLW